MGIFYMQHWINTVQLLTAIEQARLFLKEIEKMGSFTCWIAQVISFAFMLLLNLRYCCCLAVALTVLLKSNDNSGPRKWQLHLCCREDVRVTWAVMQLGWGGGLVPVLCVCVVVPLLHNGSVVLPAAESPGTRHHVMWADRSYLPSMPCT